MAAKKWLNSIEKLKKKNQFDVLCDRQTESIVDNYDSWLGAEIDSEVCNRAMVETFHATLLTSVACSIATGRSPRS